MTTIKSLLDSLTVEQRRLLMYAFENSLEQFVIMQDGRYIGVNTSKVPYLIPDLALSVGRWAVGECKRKGVKTL